MAERATSSFEKIYPYNRHAFKYARISEGLPASVTESIKEAIPAFAKRLKGFDCPDAVLTDPETRSSSPVKLLRNDKMQSEKFMGMFLCGEGAGYAGGIMSAAVDGIKCAEILIESDG